MPNLCSYERHIRYSFQDWSSDASGVDDEFLHLTYLENFFLDLGFVKDILGRKMKDSVSYLLYVLPLMLGLVLEVNERLEGVIIWGRKTFWVGMSSSGWDLKIRKHYTQFIITFFNYF